MTNVINPPTDTKKSPDPAPAPRKKRRPLKILLALLVIFLLLVALAPTLLSTGPGRNFLLSQINSRIPGKVHFTDLSLGWFSSASAKGFELRDPEGKIVLAFNDASTGISILGYLTNSDYNIGEVNVTNLRGDIVTNPDGSTNLTNALIKKSTTPPPAPGKKPAPAKPAYVRGTVNIQIDQLTFTAPDTPKLIIDKTSIKVRSLPDAADVYIIAQLHSGETRPAKIDITANLTQLRADHPAGTGRAQISDLDLAALTPLLSALSLELTPTGVFNADLTFASTADSATLKGTPIINKFSVSGPMLKGDTLRSATVKFPLDMQFRGGVITLNASGLESDFLSLKLNGTTALERLQPASKPAPTSFDLTGTLDYDLASLTAALPHWLPEKFAVQGKRSAPIRVKGPLTADAGLKKFLKLQVDVTPGWDSAAYSGITLGKADLPLALAGGILTIAPTDIPANGGTFRAQGALDLNQTPPVYKLAKAQAPHRLMSNLAINQEIAAGPLKFLPLMWGSSGKDASLLNISGNANIDVADADLPLDMEALKARGTMNAVISIEKLRTDAPIFSQLGNSIGGLLQLTGLQKTASMEGNIDKVTVALKDGKFNYQNFRVGSSAASLTFSGAVGVDESLAVNIDMSTASVSVPIPVAVTGTISKPKLTVSDAFVKNLGKDIGKDVQNIGKDIGKGLQDIFKPKK